MTYHDSWYIHSWYLSQPAVVYFFQADALFAQPQRTLNFGLFLLFVENLHTLWCTFTVLDNAVVCTPKLINNTHLDWEGYYWGNTRHHQKSHLACNWEKKDSRAPCQHLRFLKSFFRGCSKFLGFQLFHRWFHCEDTQNILFCEY